MWIIIQLIGIFIVFLAQMFNRYFGLSIYGVGMYMFLTVFFLSWILPYAYQIAPTFFQAYFLGIVGLSSFGLIGSYLVFNESLQLINIIGVVIAIIGCILMNIKI
ncbi:MAG: hypothetical protein ACOCP4_01910 [Candidatus Woesearchaeota archaeon]